MSQVPKNLLLAPLIFTLILLSLALTIPHQTPRDVAILNAIHAKATPTLTLLARAATFIGAPHTVWPLTIILTTILYLRRPRRAAYLLALTVLASGVLESVLKLVVRRPRPIIPWAYVHETTYSFPSGHATLAVALYGTLLWITLRTPTPRWQRAITAVLAPVMILAIGLSRLYLGAHHPTDVLAGYLMGALTLSLAIAADLAL